MTEMFNMVYRNGGERTGSTMDDVTAEIKLYDIDSTLGIQEIIDANGAAKGVEILSCLRKEARKNGATLGRFVVQNVYLLDENGNVAVILPETFEDATDKDKESFFDVMHAKEFQMAGGIKCLHTKQYL